VFISYLLVRLCDTKSRVVVVILFLIVGKFLSEFLATDPEVAGSIPDPARFPEK
jgi:hypothetical protein